MSKEYFNYGEALCDAVDIIVSEKLKTLGYDITKVCTVIDDTHKKLGRYTVQEETIKYEAYSIETNYNIGDFVLVIIPNGDYSMQKNIIGKAMVEDDLTSSTLYESPLSTILDFTGDIIDTGGIVNIDGTTNKEFSLLANNPNRTMRQLYSITNWSDYAGYERMGISVDFQTWLSEYNVQSGNYGLLFYFYKKNSTVADIEEQRAAYTYTFNMHDILGNPYQFDTYYTQEKVLDISYLTDVSQLDIFFYQNNDFVNDSGELIPYLIEEDDEFSSSGETYDQELNDNLYINNLKIFLGYPMGAFSGDELKLTANSLTYSTIATNNSKNLKLRWVHKVEDNKYELLEHSDDCELYWVRSGDTQQTIANIVGNYWTQQDITSVDGNKFAAIFDLDTNNLDKNIENRVKVVGRIQQKDGNWAQYDSNIVTFTSEDPRVDQTTADALSGLSIKCSDGTEGNYLMYNQNSEIINEGQGQGFNRTFEILYKGAKLAASEIKNEISEVSWSLPINTTSNDSYTMLLYKPGDLRSSGVTEDIDLDSLTSNLFQRKITGDDTSYDQNYSIQNTWYISNAHNTISCEVITKSGIIYKTNKELIFGKANSQGSNLSLVVQFTNNKNAYEVLTNDNNIISNKPIMSLKGLIYDLSGKLITTANGTWTWEFAKGTDFIFTHDDGSIINGNPNTQIVKMKLGDVNNVENISYNVIKVTYSEGEQQVSTLFPIPIKTLTTSDGNTIARCQCFEGCRRVIYNAQGIPSYYTDIYKLLNADGGTVPNITWSIAPNNDGKSPTLKQVQRGGDVYYALLANPVFIKDYDYEVYVTAASGSTIYWKQPILIMQSEHDMALINNWNGEMNLNEGNGTILSTMIAAGKKDDDNKFSGIVLGDVAGVGIDAIGLYGISKGDITFSLTDRGLASFERISNSINSHAFFGADNYILSHDSPTFDAAGNETGCSQHLLFDIDERFLEFKNDSSKPGGILLSTSESSDKPYLSLKEESGSEMLLFNNTTFKLETPGFNATSGLQLDIKNGIITMNSGAAKFTNGENFIGTADDGVNLLKLGNLRIGKNKEVYYSFVNGEGQNIEMSLTAYINKLIQDSK